LISLEAQEHKKGRFIMKTLWQPSSEEGKQYLCNENSRRQQHPCDKWLPTKQFPQRIAKTVGVPISRPQHLAEIVEMMLDCPR